MKTIVNKFRKFINNEDGAEVLEVAAIIIGAIAVIGIIAAIYSELTKKADISSEITKIDFSKVPE